MHFLAASCSSVIDVVAVFVLQKFQVFMRIVSTGDPPTYAIFNIADPAYAKPSNSMTARRYLQTPLRLPEFFPIGQWNRFK